jgi:LEA14-like dessication related protein
MRTLRLLFPAAVIALFAGGGCAALSQLLRSAFVEPTLEFKSASVGGFSLNDATINLAWELKNPNPVGIELATLQYALFVEDKQVVAGAPPAGLRIPAQGKTDLIFPANVKFQDIAPVLETFLNKDNARYRAQGTIGIDTPIGIVSLPLQKEGLFEIPKVPKVEFLPPRITNLTLFGATVEFPLTVTNRNTYALPIGNVGGFITVGGARVGNVSTGSLALTPKGASEVRIPLSINFAQAGQAALAVQRGSATVAFDGSMQAGSASIPLKFQQNLTFQR